MSSGYSTYELEQMRKAQLRAQLTETIQNMKNELMVKHANTATVTAGSHIEFSVFVTDDEIGGYSKNNVVLEESLKTDSNMNVQKTDELDFSELLYSTNKKPTKLELELDSWVEKVDERPIVTEKDAKDRTRVIAELAKTIKSTTMDIEDKINTVKMRVSSFLQGSIRLTDADKKRIEENYYEYCALCQLLEVRPTEKHPYRVEKEIARMTKVLERRQQEEYVMEVIEDILEDLGCHAKEDAILDNRVGQMFSVDGHPLCDVFVSKDESGIMFEPVGQSKEGSLEKRRQVEGSANSICSLYSVIEERAAEKGIILRRIVADPARIDQMFVQSDVSERKASKRQRKAASKNQRAMGSEG